MREDEGFKDETRSDIGIAEPRYPRERVEDILPVREVLVWGTKALLHRTFERLDDLVHLRSYGGAIFRECTDDLLHAPQTRCD